MKVRINVTQHDIDNGERREPMSCPIARAINRKVLGSAMVGDDTIVLHQAVYRRLSATQTPAMRAWRTAFDEGRMKVRPRSFTVTFR